MLLCKKRLVLGFIFFISTSIQAAEEKQSANEIKNTVKSFLIKETAGMANSDSMTIEVGKMDPNLNLTPCSSFEPFLPTGSHLRGKTSVGVRCLAPDRWVIYVPSTIKITGTYYVTAKSITQNQTITAADISASNGDLTSLPSSVVTDPNQALGHIATLSLAPGIALRQDALRVQPVVLQGQTIKLISGGEGFKVSTEAVALSNAGEGQLVKIKISSGQVLSGTAKSGGIVEVNF